MTITVLSRAAFAQENGDQGETLALSDGTSTQVWSRKTFIKNDGETLVLEKTQKVLTTDLDTGEFCQATIMAIRPNSVDIALSPEKWEMRFPTAQFIEPI